MDLIFIKNKRKCTKIVNLTKTQYNCRRNTRIANLESDDKN